MQAEAQLDVAQRFRIAKARSKRLLQKYDPSEPRDDGGKWTNGGSGDDSPAPAPLPSHGIEGLPKDIVVKDRLMDQATERGAWDMAAKELPKDKYQSGRERYNVAITAKIPPGIKSFTARHARGTVEYYNPKLAELFTVDQDEPILTRTYARPLPGLSQEIAPLPGKDVIYRGMRAEEYEKFLQTGKIVSTGEYNMEGQEGLTYWATDPGTAVSYANGFAPWPHKATFEKPAYVVATKMPKETRKVAGTGENEVGVARPIGKDEIVGVWRGDVYWHMPGDQDLNPSSYAADEKVYEAGSGSGPSSSVVWQQLDKDKSKQWQAARERSRKLLEKFNPNHEPGGSPTGGQFSSGTGSGGGGEKPSGGGKSKKPAKKEDFDKAKVTLPPDKAAQDAFIGKWNDKVGVDPATFKSNFMGGLDGPMRLSATGNQINVNGEIHDSDGKSLGNFERNINLDSKSAYSAYFKLNKSATKHDTGKKLLAGNIETYKNLGIEKVTVTANIDVGGYAWAKYGYVPTASAWSELRSKLERELTGGSSSSRPHSDNSMEADSWDMLSSDVQDDVRDKWMRETRSEFIQSEEQNWRDSGQAKNDAQQELAHNFHQYDSIPEWANDAMDKSREDRKEAGLPDIPYTNKQLHDAIDLKFESYHGDGSDKPEIEFDDDKLREPQGIDPNQPTLPGIEPPDYSKYLTEQMRDEITTDLMNAFDDKAEEDAGEMDPPSYLADSVEEYQDQYWSQRDDDEKLRHAIDYGMADIEIEPDEDEEPDEADDGMGLNPELFPPEQDPLLAAVRSNDPKSIWKVADSPRGKELLLGTGWSGVLNLKDKEQMDRFDKYVGKAAHG